MDSNTMDRNKSASLAAGTQWVDACSMCGGVVFAALGGVQAMDCFCGAKQAASTIRASLNRFKHLIFEVTGVPNALELIVFLKLVFELA